MNCKPFEVDPLPYPYDGLAPYIDAETLRIHHDVLYKRYVDKLNAALAAYPEYYCYSLEELILGREYLPPDIAQTVFNQAGGAYNHRFYFETMNPAPSAPPKGELMKAINKSFVSFNEFQKKYKEMGMAVFGSGWTWLCADGSGNLEIVNTANQDTPLSIGLHPVMCIDIWEHAYFLQYKAGRDDYIDAWFNVVYWPTAEKYYAQLQRCIV